MARWPADLHVHTVLSACAEVEMIPPRLVARAQALGLRLLGVVDHNSAGNTQAAVEAALGTDVIVKPGLEVESRETVHLLCLFDEVAQALELQEFVYRHLPSLPSGAQCRAFGQQFKVDSSGRFLGCEERPLFAATDLPAARVAQAALSRGGLVLAAHAERPACGLLGVLGFVPQDLELDGLEAGPRSAAVGRVAGSDAHRLEEVGSRYTVFEANGCAVTDLRASLRAGAFTTGETA